MTKHRLKIVIVGAGLGGLTLALSLARANFEIVVLEQASRLGEVGAGIQISANGARVLHDLDLEGELAKSSSARNGARCGIGKRARR